MRVEWRFPPFTPEAMRPKARRLLSDSLHDKAIYRSLQASPTEGICGSWCIVGHWIPVCLWHLRNGWSKILRRRYTSSLTTYKCTKRRGYGSGNKSTVIASSFFSLPPYAPQHNPDELLNNTLKQNVNLSSIPTTYSELKKNVYSGMKSLQMKPSVIMSFFRPKLTAYASWCIWGVG